MIYAYIYDLCKDSVTDDIKCHVKDDYGVLIWIGCE
jgi:hypothetical protein